MSDLITVPASAQPFMRERGDDRRREDHGAPDGVERRTGQDRRGFPMEPGRDPMHFAKFIDSSRTAEHS